jgi:hypothetical protein
MPPLASVGPIAEQRWRLSGAAVFKARDFIPGGIHGLEKVVPQEGVNVWTRKIACSAATALVS